MNDYTINIDLEDPAGFPADAGERLAELGGAASTSATRVGATFTVSAKSMVDAVRVGIDRTRKAIGAAGKVVAVEVLTVDEHDRQLEQPAFPELVGIAETAEILEVSKQRVSSLRSRPDFPAPVAELRAGPVWRKGDLSRFASTWTRKPGRPRKDSLALEEVHG